MTKKNEGNLQIGWAMRDVTPDKPVNLLGQFHLRISKGVKDPVTITALALSSDGSSGDAVIFVSCDRPHFNLQALNQCRAAVRAKAPEINVNQIIMNATHTHTAPDMISGRYEPVPDGVMKPEEYAEIFINGATEAIVEAWKNRKPGGVSWGLGTAVVGHNRRTTYFEELIAERKAGIIANGFTKMYGNTNDPKFSHIEGYEDHYVDLLYTWDPAGKLTGIIINLACPSQETEMDYYISADFWHEIRQEIRKRHGGQVQIAAQCSAAGDQSPHRLWYKEAEERMLKLRGLTMRQEIGRRVANAVDEVLPVAEQAIQTNLPLKHVVKEIQLPRRIISDEEAKQVRTDLAQLEAGDKTAGNYYAAAGRCRRALERYAAQKENPNCPMELHVVRLGNIVFTTNRFEYFLDYGTRIKARSPAEQTFVIQLTADNNGVGTYLPTERAVGGKGYGGGVYDNEVGPEGGQTIVEETVKVLNELWPETDKK